MMKALAALTALLLLPGIALAQSPADPYAPARTIIADINRIVTPNGVQENLVVTLGGARQAINVRGADKANPILVYVHGGPGAVEMPFAWSFQRPWEDFFTVVQWDQRGAGKSYALNDPAVIVPTLTPDRIRDDAIELIDYLKARYGKRKVFLLGHSWGSVVGLSVAIKRPDLLYAYIGMGQMIDARAGERMGMAWTLARAKAAGNAGAVKAIEALKPYPDSGAFTIDQADAWRGYAIGYGSLMMDRSDPTIYFDTPKLSPDYTPADRDAWSKGSALSARTLWPQLPNAGFAAIHDLQVPIVMLLGRGDYTVPASLAAAWMDRLKALSKKTIWFEHSAHMPMVEEPGLVLKALIEDVRPLAGKE